MNYKRHEILVGLFIVLLSAMGFALVLWLTVGFERNSYAFYYTILKESVSGLSVQSPVKYNGVNVGYVKDIDLDPKSPRHVILLLAIKRRVVIHKDAAASLNAQGLTGVAYIELRGGTPQAEVLTATPGHRYPIIRSAPSLMVRIDTTIRELSHNLSYLSTSLEHLLDSENRHYIDQTIKNMATVTRTLAKDSGNMHEILDKTNALLTQWAQISMKVPETLHATTQSLRDLSLGAKQFSSTSYQIQTLIPPARQTLWMLNDSSEDLGQLIQSLQRLITSLNAQPSQLIRGRARGRLGPGEH